MLRVIRGTVARNVIDATLPRTPRRCPAGRHWRFVYDITYDDPPGDQAPFSRSRCER